MNERHVENYAQRPEFLTDISDAGYQHDAHAVCAMADVLLTMPDIPEAIVSQYMINRRGSRYHVTERVLKRLREGMIYTAGIRLELEPIRNEAHYTILTTYSGQFIDGFTVGPISVGYRVSMQNEVVTDALTVEGDDGVGYKLTQMSRGHVDELFDQLHSIEVSLSEG